MNKNESAAGGVVQKKRPRVKNIRRDPRLIVVFALALTMGVVALFQLTHLRSSEFQMPQLTPRRMIDFSNRANLSSKAEFKDAREEPVLRVAIAPVLSPEHSLRFYRDLIDYLAVELRRKAVLLQRDSYAETNDLVRYGLCDLALVCTYSFVRGESEFGMEVLATPVVDGATHYYSLIIVGSANQANSLLDLRGQRFASADIISTSGWLYPALWLKERGIAATRFFAEHLIVGSHDRSIRAVASGYADAAAVHSLVYSHMLKEDPAIARKTRIIQKSPAYGMPPLVVSPNIDPGLREELQSVLLGMNRNESGRSVLRDLDIEEFIIPEDTLYDDIRRSVNIWETP